MRMSYKKNGNKPLKTPQLSVLALALGMALHPMAADASSHREAPFIAKFPQVDASDFYLFNSYEPNRDGYVTLLANYIPVQAAYGGPNYFPLDSNAVYEIHIDNDGDVVEDISFQFRFSDALTQSGEPLSFDVNGVTVTSVLKNAGAISAGSEPGLSHAESYTLDVVTGGRRSGNATAVTNQLDGTANFRKPFDNAGNKTFGESGYGSYADSFIYDINVPGCSMPGRVFAGQRYEAFKISLGEVFDLVNLVPIEGDSTPGAGDSGGFPGGVTQDPDRNTLAENNVTTLALEVHSSCLTGSGDVIGAWTTASLPQASILNPDATFERPEVVGGPLVQVSRLSNPLVNELVIGYDRKDAFNSSEPANDGQFLDFVTNPVLPLILDSLFRDAVNTTLGASIENLAPSNFPRQDLVTAFLTGFSGVNQFADAVPGEMLRLNTAIPATPKMQQQPLGLAAGDLAGFPNGRRPGDDVVDIALRVVMGALCHDLPLGEGGDPVNLGICAPEDAPVGNVPFTDGAPLSAADLNNRFPYLLTPYAGSPVDAALPTPEA
ncbi:DUF4331 domain-containing protein [Congregibacter litoralis]|uniref:DUF4331 domain-containing protein n=1 Tax=Congregibacter litoralis KT71 TaxID=314285 RepID=A4A5T8_9GAMM|nr:DUF4331 domain-containing protein [Congregibacter litoralis]EAQ98385.2 Domain protein of unknown function [Congregibacter litoralis KT71]